MPPRLSGMNTSTRSHAARLAAYGLLLVLALLTGAMALRYAWPGQPFAPPLPNLESQREMLVLHAVASGIALMLGPWQFATKLRQRRPRLHRALGWFYAASLLLGGLTALPLAMQSDGGPIAQVGFALLGLLWLVTTSVALVHIRARRIAEHRRWMLRSFVLTAGGITLRLQIVAGNVLGVPIEDYYTALAWTSWLPQALLLEWWLRRRPAPARAAQADWPDTQLEPVNE
ncbi:putative membrane protein [Roseateles asaccharophilus]